MKYDIITIGKTKSSDPMDVSMALGIESGSHLGALKTSFEGTIELEHMIHEEEIRRKGSNIEEPEVLAYAIEDENKNSKFYNVKCEEIKLWEFIILIQCFVNRLGG